jgi:DNA replication and repair protein RecF
MYLQSLEVKQFRNLKNVYIAPDPRINLIYGENASGKSSLLEAIYILGTGKSFRTSKPNCLIQKDHSQFSIFAEFVSDIGTSVKAGVHRANNTTQIKVNGVYIKRASELAHLFPIQIIEPKLNEFLNEGPDFRRRFIEWGVFHVEQRYEQIWKHYCRNLAQRNSALRQNLPDRQIQEWDHGVVQSATEIDLIRKVFIEKLIHAINTTPNIPDLFLSCSIDYYQGWPLELSYFEGLTRYLASDKDRGFTQLGPHRADIRIKVGKQQAKEVLSRGQHKMLISSLLLSQSRIVKDELGKNVILLIDDLGSELDQKSQKMLMQMVKAANCQAFITSSNRETLLEACGDIPYKMFHVEHGHIRQVV